MPCILNINIVGFIHVDYDNTIFSRTRLTSTSTCPKANIITVFENLNNKSYSVYVQSRPMIVLDADPLVIYSKY